MKEPEDHQEYLLQIRDRQILEMEKQLCEFPQPGEVEFAVEVHKRRIRELELEVERCHAIMKITCPSIEDLKAERDQLRELIAREADHNDLHEWLNPIQAETLKAERDRYRKALEDMQKRMKLYSLDNYFRDVVEEALRGE